MFLQCGYWIVCLIVNTTVVVQVYNKIRIYAHKAATEITIAGLK